MPYWQTLSVWKSIQDFGLIKYRRLFHQPDTTHISPTSPTEKQINFMDKYLSTFLLQYFKIFEFIANSREIQLSNKSGEIGKPCLLLARELTKVYFSGLPLVLSGFSAQQYQAFDTWRSNSSRSNGWLLQCHSFFIHARNMLKQPLPCSLVTKNQLSTSTEKETRNS